METIAIILALAIILEALVEIIKGMVPGTVKTPEALWPLCSAVVGIVLCIGAQVNMLEIAGITMAIPYLGQVLTGLLISRGASFVHDVWGRINGGSENKA